MEVTTRFHKSIPLGELAIKYKEPYPGIDGYIRQSIENREKEPKRVSQLRKLICDEVPQKGGVYYLIDNGEVIYVGRSNNMQERLLQHVSGYLRQADEIALQFVEGGVPMQNIVEAVAIREFMPRINRIGKVV